MIGIWFLIFSFIAIGLYALIAFSTSKESRVRAVRQKYGYIFSMIDNATWEQLRALKEAEENEINEILKEK